MRSSQPLERPSNQTKASGNNRKIRSTQAQRACHISSLVVAEIKGTSLTAPYSGGSESRTWSCQNPGLCSDALPGVLLGDVLLSTSTHPYFADWGPLQRHDTSPYIQLLFRVLRPCLLSRKQCYLTQKRLPAGLAFPAKAQTRSACHKLEQTLKCGQLRRTASYLTQHLFQRGEGLKMELYPGQHTLPPSFTGATFCKEVRLSYTSRQPLVSAAHQDAHVPIPI